jgi:ubiquitin-like protein ATG12
VAKVSTNQRFEMVVRFVRRKLQLKDHESVFCYIGNVFSPSLDEGVGNLWTVSYTRPWRRRSQCVYLKENLTNVVQCFKTGDELVVGYAMSPAFG